MKKTLIASAVAAATLSTFSAMTLAAEAAMPEFYGSLELVHRSDDYDDAQPNKHEFKDTGSTLGIKHSHELDSGTSVFMKAEFEYRGDSTDSAGVNDPKSNGIDKLDEAYVGIKGGFGSIQFGSDDTVYEWVDVTDQYEEIRFDGEIAELKEGDNFQYMLEAGEGLKIGATLPIDSDSMFGGALAAQYSMDAMTFAFAYAMGREDAPNMEAGDTFGLGASFGMDALTLNVQYEARDLSNYDKTQDETESHAALQGVYSMGSNAFRLGYAMLGYDQADGSQVEIAAVHNLSDSAFVYAEAGMETYEPDVGADEDTTSLALGFTYKF